MSGIFLSYEHQSTAIARQLADDMATLGHEVWFDQALSGAQAWWEHIMAQIRACDVLVFLLTPAALDSTACSRECDYATALHKPVLPLLVADGVAPNLLRPALSRLQYVDCRELDRASGLRLARSKCLSNSRDTCYYAGTVWKDAGCARPRHTTALCG